MDSRLGDRRAELLRMRQATEDDLLAQQQEFLAKPQQPAAKVVRATRAAPAAAQAGHAPLSAFRREHMAQQVAAPRAAQPASAVRFAPKVLRPSQAASVDDDDDDDDEDIEVDDDDNEGGGYSAPRIEAPAVLSEIVERDSSNHVALPPSVRHIPLGSVHKGFPSTFRIATASALPSSTNQPAKKSLFALQREQERAKQQQAGSAAQGGDRAAEAPQRAWEQGGEHKEPQWRDEAKVEAVTNDRQRINAENERKLASMSPAEIDEAQRELHASLPPALIARLLHGKSAMTAVADNSATRPAMDRLFGQKTPPADDSPQPATRVVDAARPTASAAPSARSIPVNPSPVPYPQSAKTQWMAPVPTPAAPPQWQTLSWHTGLTSTTDASSAASEVGTAWQYWRLDFRGEWIDERQHSSGAEDRYDGLYHHGLHAERAGYSLDEALHLCHSQLPAQRQLMLELLARVLARVNDGRYAVPQPVSEARLLTVDFNALVLERLLVLGVPTALRVAMDDAAVGIVAAAVRGVEALLYRRAEDTRRRQRRLTWRGHWLLPAELSQQALDAWDKPFEPAAVEKMLARDEAQEVRDNSEDEAACRRDVVVGLVRMQLLPRLRFLLDVHSTPTDSAVSSAATETRAFTPLVNSILHILLLVAQHSASAAEAVASTPHLLPLLSSLTLSMPQSSAANPHLLPLLSLLCTSPAVVRQLASSNALLHCHSYMLVANGLPGAIAPQPTAAAFALSRDALQLWRACLDTRALLDVGAEEFTTFFPVLMQILMRRHAGTAAGVAAEHKEEQKQPEEAEDQREGGWEREELEQVRAAYNVLEALCGCLGNGDAKDAAQEEEASSVSVTHLVSSVDHAIAQFTSLFIAQLPSARHTELHVGCMAGMAHCVASFYERLPASAVFSASFSAQQLERQWQAVWGKWDDSPVIAHVLAQLCSLGAAVQSSYSPAIFCFPATSLTTPAVSYVDFLSSVCRWLLASVAVATDARAAVFERLRDSAVLRSLVRVAATLSEWPVLDAHAALLLYHIAMLHHHSASDFSLDAYRAALVAVCPLLSAGYRSEADELLRMLLLGDRSLSAMRAAQESTWARGRSGQLVCGVCEWSSRDTMSAASLRDKLLPALRVSLDLLQQTDQRGAEQTLVQHASSSSVTVSLYDQSSTWPLLLSRNLLLLTSLPPTSSASHTSVLRSYTHYLGLLVDAGLWSTAHDRTVAARALLELLVRSPDCTAEPQLSLPLTHCSHALLSSDSESGGGGEFDTGWLNRRRSGWGGNFFLFASEAVELYVSEAVGEEVWAEPLLLLARRSLARDYRLMLYSRCMDVDVAVRASWDGWRGVLWPREDSPEVLAVYREYVGKRGGGRSREGGVLWEVAAHHLLCDWLGEAAVRERRDVAGKEERIRQRLGAVDDSVVHALLSYRYMRD